MQSRYDSTEAARWVHELTTPPNRPAPVSELLALRTYTARLIGREADLVLHGGGNTSVKATATTILGETVDVLHVKGSGWDLATIEPPGHPAVRLAPLRALRRLDSMTDEAMVNELRTQLLDASAPNPSVETLLHALLPARFIDHTHADAILALADQPDGRRIFASIFGRGLVWIPYVMPGFALAKRCAEVFDQVASETEPTVMVLEKHGLFTWGDTAQQSYERTIDAVTRAERYASERSRTPVGAKAPAVSGDRETLVSPVSLPSASSAGSPSHSRAAEVLPRLRGVLAKLADAPPERGSILRLRSTPCLDALLARPDAAELVSKGCMTPDHVLRTKPTALFVDRPVYGDPLALTMQLESAIAEYAKAYDAYFEQMCAAKGVTRKKLDPWPRVILLPGLGAVGVSSSAKDADIALDIYEHTAAVMQTAADVGSYAPCSRADLFDVEYWSLEQAKLKATAELPLSRSIAIVTGAASGIGRATVARLLGAGAQVAMLDRDAPSLASASGGLRYFHKGRVIAITVDVSDSTQVAAALERVVQEWGGLDLVVSNAGTAPEGKLETAAGQESLRSSLDVNLLSHASVSSAAVEVFGMQGRGGCLLFNASKAAFNPGPGFGPYAVAKAALVGLMRQYAVDLGARGIRSNAVNADRIRTGLFGGGVLESRAKARGLSVDDYFRSNLLSREVTADDVADAFVYLATARATTGCIVTVDGGNAAAFPR
jgi:rhamnose utilization protein RhaD (predicted bifunctional aldolase and dehydrogenase)/NAD(P)-dependent dehydrogenase (short-subunit alcohol dehydrogenase family)